MSIDRRQRASVSLTHAWQPWQEKKACFRTALAPPLIDRLNGDGRARTADLGFMNPSL